jgi:hypothetical protein
MERCLLIALSMRSQQRIGFLSILVVTGLLAGCGSISGTLGDDGGGGQDGGGPPACRTLTEAACRARTDCSVGACSVCGPPAFAGCYDATHELPPACPGVSCPAQCSALDEASCRARTDCQVLTCPDCNGGTHFVGCGLPGAATACPASPCPIACAQVTSKDACAARSDCHAVFTDPHDCACAALGCCAQFSGCAAGGQATCKSPDILCKIATPYCEGPYVVSYTSNCYEGCVLSTACAP